MDNIHEKELATVRGALQHALDELRRVNELHACVRPDVRFMAQKALTDTELPPIPHASAIEKRIVGKLVTDLLAAGFSLSVNDGEETTVRMATDPALIYPNLCSTDSDQLIVHWPTGRYVGHVVLVWGNDTEVLADNSSSLAEHVLGADMLADQLERGGA